MKNKKGFTLVELLAVIVVLAIIMIIAVPAVLNSMTDARKSSFAIYGQKLIGAAQSKAQAEALKGNSINGVCYSVTDLIDGATGSYEGKVVVTVAGDKTTYAVTLKDKNYVISAANDKQLEESKSADASTIGISIEPGTLYTLDEDKLTAVNGTLDEDEKITFTCAE